VAPQYPFEVHTPYRLFYSDMIEALTVTLIDGEIGVYAGHSFFTAPTRPCILRIKDKKGLWREAFVDGGFLEVKAHKTVLMVNTAEWPAEIDRSRALAAKERAEARIRESSFRFEAERARSDLRRADLRLKARDLYQGSDAPPAPPES
jgi:F-type H+-transporting ATPase subunit epsilon